MMLAQLNCLKMPDEPARSAFQGANPLPDRGTWLHGHVKIGLPCRAGCSCSAEVWADLVVDQMADFEPDRPFRVAVIVPTEEEPTRVIVWTKHFDLQVRAEIFGDMMVSEQDWHANVLEKLGFTKMEVWP